MLHVVVSVEEFENVWNGLIEANKPALVLFTSCKNDDGSHWCSDCEKTEPLYNTLAEEAKAAGIPFYIFLAGNRAQWKDQQNKFRTHKLVRLTSVPTLCFFDGKKIPRRLMELDILSAEHRNLLIEG